MATQENFFGRIKWFSNTKGYGFITNVTEGPNKDTDVFLHFSAIQAPESVYKTVYEGEYVSFSTTTDENGKVTACDVTGINKGPLLCEHPTKKVLQILRESGNDGDKTSGGKKGGKGGRGQGGKGGRSRYEKKDEEPETHTDNQKSDNKFDCLENDAENTE